VSAQGVAQRDEMVFEAARRAGVPICMALSGGYARDSAAVISTCLKHVIEKFELVRPSSSTDSKL
jgi:histone deacetylase 11